ncbi:MAG: GlcG/HbpS family heme-binding protein [Allorhizobium sp.]
MLTIKRLDQADAQVLLTGAREKSLEIGVPMCVAITDESGQLIAFERMDGGKVTSTTIAIDKAFTAAAARKATHEYGDSSQPGKPTFGIHSAIGGRLMVVGGGLPVIVDGAVVGGIGLSSGTPAQDLQCAQAGLDRFLNTLAK